MSFPRYPEYKDSGVEWLGEVPVHWNVSTLKRLIERNDGGVWGDDPDGESDTIVLRSTEQTVDGRWKIDEPAFRKLSARDQLSARLETGDLLVTKSSGSSLHIGKATLVTDEIARLGCCYSNFMQRIRFRSDFDPRLAWHVLNNEIARTQFDLASNSTTGLANLNGTMIGEVLLAVPPGPEQTAIAAFLDRETAKIDALVAEQETLIALLKEKRQAVISHAVTKGLNPDAPMKPSGIEWLGDVPAHWEMRRLKYLGRAITGLTYAPDDVVDELGGILVLRSSNVQDGQISMDDNVYVSAAVPELLITTLGDVLICSRNGSRALIGKNALIGESAVGVTFGAFMTVFRSHFNPFLYWIFNSPLFDFQSGSFLTSTINQLTIGTLNDFEVPLPPAFEQEAINEHLKASSATFSGLLAEATRAITLLKERRSALISAAVTGQIDVRGLEG